MAGEAEVSEQTVYNYFQTKEQLVTDRDQLIQDQLSRLIRTWAPGTTPAAAIRGFVLDTVKGIRRLSKVTGCQVQRVRRVDWFLTVTPSMAADLGNLGA